MNGDPEAIDSLVQQLSANDARHADDGLSSRSRNVHWSGTGAERFRETIEEEVAAMRRAADRLDEATQVLSRHAEVVRERSARIRAFEQEVADWFGNQLKAVKDLATDPPWITWPWSPHNLPGPGNKAWLEVGEFIRRQGLIP